MYQWILCWRGWGAIYQRIQYLIFTQIGCNCSLFLDYELCVCFCYHLKWRNGVFQLFIVDGEKLKNQPAAVMHNVQRFLHIEPHYEYNDLLR